MRLASITLAILLAALPVSAGEIVSTRVTTEGRVLIGDPVTLEVELRHQHKDSYSLRVDPSGLGHFELRGKPEVETVRQDGELSTTRYRIRLIPFATGRLPVAPLFLESQTEQLQTPPVVVDVSPLTGPQDYDIKEIRLLPRPPAGGRVLAVFTTLLLCAAPLYLALRYGRLQRPVPAQQPPPPLPQATLEDEAVRRLRRLLSSGLAVTDVKTFHIELSEILTWYLAERFSCSAREWTTTELLHRAEDLGVPQLLRRVYAEVLPQCDLVKFARFQPEQSVSEDAVRRSIDLFNTFRARSGDRQE